MRLPGNRRGGGGGNTPTTVTRSPGSSSSATPNRSLSTSSHNRLKDVRSHDYHMIILL